ncbi:MAG: gamma-glutamyltransferase family protein [Dehalococcoidia bacterium]
MDPRPGVTLRTGARWRGALHGPRGGVAADHPLAVGAGMAVLGAGGTAADAAIAMAAVMPVVQPYYSHLGGDSFAITYEAATRKVEALVSSGPAPGVAEADAYRATGGIPQTGARAVTVPGCVDGWWQLHQRYGRLNWDGLFEPAIDYAKDGFPASRQLVDEIEGGRGKCAPAGFFSEVFGNVTRAGQRVIQPALARTLSSIAVHGADGFYAGDAASTCRAALEADGVAFRADEWRGPARWVTPVTAEFAGHRVFTQPLPTQGFVLPLALRRYAELLDERPDANAAVLQHGALAEAFAVRYERAGDPDVTGLDTQRLVDDDGPSAGASIAALEQGDTTYLLAIDDEGNAVSLIQSVFAHWGSGLWAPEAGVLFNNRMCGFSLEAGHPNELAPGKRPVHTLHCYLATDGEGKLRIVGGTPGAMQQPQTNLQVLDHLLRGGMDVQDALDMPRWSLGSFSMFSRDFGRVTIEEHEPDMLTSAFEATGIATEQVPAWDSPMGRAYVAVLQDDGVAIGADIRGEGTAAVF